MFYKINLELETLNIKLLWTLTPHLIAKKTCCPVVSCLLTFIIFVKSKFPRK